MLLQHRLSTSSSNLLQQTSKPFIKFSWNGKWKTVSNHLKFILLDKTMNSGKKNKVKMRDFHYFLFEPTKV